MKEFIAYTFTTIFAIITCTWVLVFTDADYDMKIAASIILVYLGWTTNMLSIENRKDEKNI